MGRHALLQQNFLRLLTGDRIRVVGLVIGTNLPPAGKTGITELPFSKV